MATGDEAALHILIRVSIESTSLVEDAQKGCGPVTDGMQGREGTQALVQVPSDGQRVPYTRPVLVRVLQAARR